MLPIIHSFSAAPIESGSGAAADVEDLEGILEVRVHYAVVHQFEEVGGLAVQTSVLGGAVIVIFVSIAGQDAQANKT